MAISAQFTADFTDWQASVDAADKQLGGLKTTSESVGPTLNAQAKIAGEAIRGLAGDVTDLGSKYLAAYGEDEAATRKLVVALQAQGTASEGVVLAYQAMATEFQNTTGFADDAVVSAQAVFTTIGKVGPENMGAALTAATDLATYMGTDLETAARQMAGAFGSGGEKLGALGKLMGDSIEKGADFTTIIDAMNKKFGGQAAADMETTNGKMRAMALHFGDAEEKAGALVAAGLTPMMDAFLALPEPMQSVLSVSGALGKDLGGLAFSIGSTVGAIAPLITMLAGSAGMAAAIAGVSAAFAALLPFLLPAGLIIGGIVGVYLAFKNWDAIVGIVSSVYNAIKTYLVDKFNAIVSSIMAPINAVTGAFKLMYDKVVGHSYVPDMIEEIKTEFGLLNSVMVAPALAATKQTEDAFKGMAAGAASAAKTYQLMGTPGKDSVIAGWSPNAPLPGGSIFDGAHRLAVPSTLPAPPMTGYLQLKNGMTINLNGTFISSPEELARTIEGYMMDSYRSGGNRLPA